MGIAVGMATSIPPHNLTEVVEATLHLIENPKVGVDDLVKFEGEFGLTAAIDQMIRSGERVFAYKVQGMRFDVGTPIGLIKATIGLALQDPRYSAQIKQFFKEIDTLDSYIYQQNKE